MIHYFGGRDTLLAATASLLASGRWQRWAAALDGAGISGLDALWEVLVQESSDGTIRALLELRLAGITEARIPPADAARLRSGLARALESSPEELPHAAALEGILEGYLVALFSGAPKEEVREAFFRYWLSYVR